MFDWASDSEGSEFDLDRHETKVRSFEGGYSLLKLSTTCRSCRRLDPGPCPLLVLPGDILRFALIRKKMMAGEIERLAGTCRQMLGTRDYPWELCIVELVQLQMERNESTDPEV